MIVKINDINIHYEKLGNNNKKNFIILHGWGQNTHTMHEMSKFISSNYSVYNIDLPGFGKSNITEPLTVKEYAEIITNFCIINNIKKFSALGHSFGGRILIEIASNTEMIEKLFLVDAAGIKKSKSFMTITRELTYKAMKKFITFDKKNYDEYLRNIRIVFGSTDYINSNPILRDVLVKAINYDQKNDLHKIASHTYIMWGRNDNDTPIYMAKLMKKEIINSKMTIFENSGHYPFIDEKDNFYSVLERYINE